MQYVAQVSLLGELEVIRRHCSLEAGKYSTRELARSGSGKELSQHLLAIASCG